MKKIDIPYLLIKATLGALSLVPRPVMGKVAIVIGRLWYLMDAYHRKIASENMQRAFGDTLSPPQRLRLARDNFIQMARAALELPSLMRINKDNLDTYVTFSGTENVSKALSEGKGAIVLTGHFGNWELLNLVVSLKFGPSYAMARPLDFTPMDKVLTEIRTRTGTTLVDKQGSANLVRQLLREQKMIGILLDQNASWYEGVYVNFFGHPACTNKGLAMFALRYGTPVIPAYNIRGKDGRYTMIFEPPVPLIKTGDTRRDVLKNTALYNRVIESFIRKAPDHWFWVHRRWRIIPVPEKARHKLLIDDDIHLDFKG